MSRSRKHQKSPGYDYWGKRALSGNCGHGPEVKKMTKKKERAQERQLIHKIKKGTKET